ncbi:MAG TPA: methionyl-tRNA formyltransferase [Alphaproteobacteria bacterium]|jgi:methionyl-tRNA formyltransferase
MNLVFMGTPDFSVPALEALIAAGYRVIAVYTQPPRPAGRGQKEQPSPVQRAAEAHGLTVRSPKSLRDEAAQAEFKALGADLAVVAAYGLILPKAILDAPLRGCLNIHASLLPRWRGAAPIQRAIEAGDAETGITIMVMDEGLDTGPMLLKESVPIAPATTAGALHDALAVLGAKLIVRAVAGLVDESLIPVPQPAEGVTYAKKIAKEETRLDWHAPAAVLERRIRAFNPVPGAWFEARGERIRVLRGAAEAARAGAAPGTVLDAEFRIACGEGALRPLELQRAGKAPMDAAAFLRGFPLPPRTRLG